MDDTIRILNRNQTHFTVAAPSPISVFLSRRHHYVNNLPTDQFSINKYASAYQKLSTYARWCAVKGEA